MKSNSSCLFINFVVYLLISNLVGSSFDTNLVGSYFDINLCCFILLNQWQHKGQQSLPFALMSTPTYNELPMKIRSSFMNKMLPLCFMSSDICLFFCTDHSLVPVLHFLLFSFWFILLFSLFEINGKWMPLEINFS